MRVRRALLGLNPPAVEAEMAGERATHSALLEGARRQVAAFVAEERSLTDRLARLRARLAHLESAVASMALTEARDQRIAIRAEERLQQEVGALEASHRLRSAELRREEASLRALLLRDEEHFRCLVARLRAAISAERSGAPPGRTTASPEALGPEVPIPSQPDLEAVQHHPVPEAALMEAAVSIESDLDPEGPESSDLKTAGPD